MTREDEMIRAVRFGFRTIRAITIQAGSIRKAARAIVSALEIT
jgi:hypothetical protein